MNAEEIRLNLSHCQYPTRGLGYGRRVGIWLQGCSIHCPGCIVPETWETTPKHNVALPWLLNELLEWLNEADGVTISGGEPFDQPLALLSLVSALRTLCFGDILVYSGYPWRKLEAEHSAVVRRVDAVASEPFVAARHTGMPLVGSANQQVHLLTDLARERYTDWPHFDHEIGICERDGVIHMTGILRPGELTQIAGRPLTTQLEGKGDTCHNLDALSRRVTGSGHAPRRQLTARLETAANFASCPRWANRNCPGQSLMKR